MKGITKTTTCPVCGTGKMPEAEYCFKCLEYRDNQQRMAREKKRREHFGSEWDHVR